MPWAEQIEGWLTAERLQVTRVHELLAERGCEVSYSSLRRFIRRRGWRQRQPVTVRMEDGPPGEVAEMDLEAAWACFGGVPRYLGIEIRRRYDGIGHGASSQRSRRACSATQPRQFGEVYPSYKIVGTIGPKPATGPPARIPW